ncbi:MAG: PilZ domain-containing protein [Deltaproteobacteria bacterium]|nr:PilZ domain-containing protein [Deltaproteobacteria bacterium]
MSMGLLYGVIALAIGVVLLFFRLEGVAARLTLVEQAIRAIAPAERHVGGDHRTFRLQTDIAASVTYRDQTFDVSVVDISTTGAQVVGVEAERGEVLTLNIPSGRSGQASCEIKVMRVLDNGGRGCVFVSPSQRFVKAVKIIRGKEVKRRMSQG